MKVLKFIFSLLVTLALVYCLNRSWDLGATRLPPLGKFLDPAHGFWRNIEPDNRREAEKLDIPGLKDEVTVVFDSLAIPHIFAKNDEDLYLAQGYVTAMHRLWQMEFQVLAGTGRVSEVIGRGKDDVFLNYDRGQRRQGMVFAAKNSISAMEKNPTTKMSLDQYTNGVNQYISQLDYEDLPFEYKLLDYEPQTWTSFNSAVLLKNMAQTLSMSNKDMQMTNALQLYGKDVVELLFPDEEGVGDPIVDKANKWNITPIKLDSIPSALPGGLIAIRQLPQSDPNTGSNNWAVHGSKTTTGAPMLCGDPHLNLSLPSIWYSLQLHAPGINVMGASLPGAPSIVIGFNDSIAWSVTNAQRDLVDWYKITFQQERRDKYLLDDKWVDSEKVVEAFNVRGGPVFYDTIIYTRWGPVTYDKNFRADDNRNGYAMKWKDHEAIDVYPTFYKLNRGKNFNDYVEALKHFTSPPHNFVFASAAGDIAIRVQGEYPVRRKLEGKFVLDGSRTSSDWHAFIPFDQVAQDKNPARGFVSSANQRPADPTYPYYVTARSYEAYRNRRINQVLNASSSISVQDMMKLQTDNFNIQASESLPLLLSSIDVAALSEEERSVYNVLKSWDYINNEEAEGASYFEAWMNNLTAMIWDEFRSEQYLLSSPTDFTTIRLLKEQPGLSFFDIQATTEKETATDVIRKSFKNAVDEIREWKSAHPELKRAAWADYKDSYIGHLLRIDPLSIHIRHGGGAGIVNAHSKTHGPSWRMVVSLEKSGVKAWAVYPGGQSGNPGSHHYSDLLGRWTADTYFSLVFLRSPEDQAARTFTTTKLIPSAK